MSRYKVGKYKYVCDVCHEIIDDKNYMIVADFSYKFIWYSLYET